VEENQKQMKTVDIILHEVIGCKFHIYICFWLDDFSVEPKCRIMDRASPTKLSMVSSQFSYALKPRKNRAVPIVP
jgi:hypothetical protein